MKRNPQSKVVDSFTKRIETPCGNLYATIVPDEAIEEEGFEYSDVLARLGKAGNCQAAMIEALSVLLSFVRRHSNGALIDLLKRLKGIQCQRWNGSSSQAVSCIDGLATALLEMLDNESEGGAKEGK